MDTNKTYTKELATAYVMSKRYELKDMEAWLFSQIGPKGQKRLKAQVEEEMSKEQIA
jgi:hypothetical protein